MEKEQKPIVLHFTPDKVEAYARKMIVDAKGKKAPAAQVAMFEDIATLVKLAGGMLVKTDKPKK